VLVIPERISALGYNGFARSDSRPRWIPRGRRLLGPVWRPNLGGGHLKSRGEESARPEILPHEEVRRFRSTEKQGRGPHQGRERRRVREAPREPNAGRSPDRRGEAGANMPGMRQIGQGHPVGQGGKRPSQMVLQAVRKDLHPRERGPHRPEEAAHENDGEIPGERPHRDVRQRGLEGGQDIDDDRPLLDGEGLRGVERPAGLDRPFRRGLHRREILHRGPFGGRAKSGWEEMPRPLEEPMVRGRGSGARKEGDGHRRGEGQIQLGEGARRVQKPHQARLDPDP